MRIMSKEGRVSLAVVQTGPHCTMGHRTGRAQGALITRPAHRAGRVGAGSREGEQRAGMMMDEAAAGCLQWTGLRCRCVAVWRAGRPGSA